jgi:hypothetical protein
MVSGVNRMPSEIVEIAFPYRAVYRRPRRRNYEDEWFRASLPLAIECLTDAEAPVVCRVRNSLREKDPIEQYDYAVRAYDGKFWRPCGRDYDNRPIGLDEFWALAAASSDPRSPTWGRNPFPDIASPDPDRRYKSGAWLNGLQTLEAVGAKDVVRSGRDDAEARLRCGINGYRFIEGIFYETCSEPRIVIAIKGQNLSFSVVTDDDLPEAYERAVFRVDRLAEARKLCAALIRRHDVRKWGMALLPRIDVPHPEFLQRDDLVDAVRLQGPSIMKDIRKFAAWLPRGMPMEMFLEMRDRFARLMGADASRADADGFCKALAKEAAWAASLKEDFGCDDDMPYGINYFARASASLLNLWTQFEGGRIEPAEPALAEEDGLALASLAPVSAT